jgi:hypothetical protein
MSPRRLKTFEIATYLVAGLCALFFRVQTGFYGFDWYLVRDCLDTFIAPYGIFILLSLLLHLSKSFHLAVLSLIASTLVLVYTLVAYIRVLYVMKCNPRACWVFVGTPIVLFVVWFAFLVVGIAGIGLYSHWRRVGV